MSTLGLRAREVRAARPREAHRDRRSSLSLDEPQAHVFDAERFGLETVKVLTVFLTGAECPYSCVFCDLWQHTLLGPTPEGSLPGQLRWLADNLRRERLRGAGPSQMRDESETKVSVLKLYNASNFFDNRAVPESDDDDIVAAVGRLPLKRGARVVVECHPKIVLSNAGYDRLKRTVGKLSALGYQLEVAFGLETVAPGGLERLNKGAGLVDFERAFERTTAAGASIRVFVLYGIPLETSVQDQEFERVQSDWTLATLVWARDRGALCASVIPVRPGNGTLEVLQGRGLWQPPTLEGLVSVFEQSVRVQSVTPRFDVHLDTWDLDCIPSGNLDRAAAQAVRDRLVKLNRDGRGAA